MTALLIGAVLIVAGLYANLLYLDRQSKRQAAMQQTLVDGAQRLADVAATMLAPPAQPDMPPPADQQPYGYVDAYRDPMDHFEHEVAMWSDQRVGDLRPGEPIMPGLPRDDGPAPWLQ